MDRQTASPSSSRGLGNGTPTSPKPMPGYSKSSIFEKQKHASRSVPSRHVDPDQNTYRSKRHNTGCPCSYECNQPCCVHTMAMVRGRIKDNEDRPLISPIEHTIQLPHSPIHTYGSTESSSSTADSRDQLLGETEARPPLVKYI